MIRGLTETYASDIKIHISDSHSLMTPVCPNCHIVYILDKWFWASCVLLLARHFVKSLQSGIVKTELPFYTKCFVLSICCVGWSMFPFIVRADPTFITYIQLSFASRFGRFVKPTWWWSKRPKHVVDDNWIVMFKNLCSRWQ